MFKLIFMRRGRATLVAALVALAVVALIEQRPPAPIGNLAECGAAIGFLVVLAWATSGPVQNAIVVGISLLVGLTLVDGGLVIMDKLAPTSAPQPATSDAGLSKSRPIVGWGPVKPGVFRVFKAGGDGKTLFDVHVTIDATLNRKTVPSARTGAIAFFGDSFIFGEGLDDADTLPQAFARLNNANIPVWNLAYAGWSPAQNLAALQAGLYRPLLGSPRHFVLFATSFHIERTACKGGWTLAPSARFILAGGELVNAGPCATPLRATLTRFVRRFAIYDRVERIFAGNTRRDVETFLKIVETFIATARREYDAPTTVLYKMGEEQYLRGTGYTEASLVDALRAAGVDVLVEALPPIADPSRYEIRGEGHPSSLANEALASLIEDHLKAVDPAALDAPGAEPGQR